MKKRAPLPPGYCIFEDEREYWNPRKVFTPACWNEEEKIWYHFPLPRKGRGALFSRIRNYKHYSSARRFLMKYLISQSSSGAIRPNRS